LRWWRNRLEHEYGVKARILRHFNLARWVTCDDERAEKNS
jgi:peptide subunit release factor RF-3